MRCCGHAIPIASTSGCATTSKEASLLCSRVATEERTGGVFDQGELLRERLCAPPPAPQMEATEQEAAPAPSRWNLRHIGATFDFLGGYSLAGVSKYLRHVGIRLRRGRPQNFSPDPAYRQKEAALLAALQHAAQQPGQVVALFVDEMSYTRWPQPSADWCAQAPAPRPVGERKGARFQRYRVVGALDAQCGRVSFLQASRISGHVFSRFLRQLDQAYPQAQIIYVIWDNWPVHSSDVVKATLAHLPRVQVISLPTYAPWLNPIEKLWRKFRQEVDYLHDLAHDWKGLRQRVQQFFAQFASGSTSLLRYVGLTGAGKLAVALRAGP